MEQKNGAATASTILGIVSLVIAVIGGITFGVIGAAIALILGIVAVVLGINAKKQTGGTKGQAGFVCGLIGIIFAVIQGYFFSYAFLKGAGTGVIIRSTVYLTAGTSFLLWLGDEITKKGIGNGVSLLIMAGIVNTLPQTFITAFNELVLAETFTTWTGIILFILFVIVYLGIIVGVIYMQQAERRVPIQYSNRTASAYGGEKSFIPIKLNSVSVIPVIFASAIIGIPSLIATVINKTAFTNFVDNYINYTSYTGFLLYMVLIFLFGYFYTLLELNPDEMAENLDKSRSYIPGVTPGEATSKYLKHVITRLTVVGTLGLMVIAALPIIFSKISNLSSNVTIGGTGLLIVVGVALETYKQLESSIVSRSYTGSAKRRRRR